MKKKGFTLIELLAVIIILAIIALIATPIVMNVIKNAKKGAAERSADNYLHAVETAAATEKLEGTPMTDGIYLIDEDGNLCKEGVDCQTNTEELIKIEMSGDKPSRGEVIIENGEVIAKNSDETEETTMFIGDYIVRYNENNSLVASTEVLITSITVDYSACTNFSVETMTTKGCTPVITIEPANATNKNLEFSFEGTYPDCYSGDQGIKKYVQIDTNTGTLSGTSKYGKGLLKQATANITVAATDGSGVVVTTTKSFYIPGSTNCGWV